MNQARLIFRSLWFYRKPHLSVLAGLVLCTAVITGALVVGDSVRYSLRHIVTMRLGKIQYALNSEGRFFSRDLADSLAHITKTTVAPVLLTEGIAINRDRDIRINRVRVIGIDDRFAGLGERELQIPGKDQAVIGRNVATRLGVKPGESILLRMAKPGKSPPDAPFATERSPSVAVTLKFTAIAGDDQLGPFNLDNNQSVPYNIFLSLRQMGSLLDLEEEANILLAAGEPGSGGGVTVMDSALATCWGPVDAGLHISIRRDPVRVMDPDGVPHPDGVQDPDGVQMHEITSDQIFIDQQTSAAITATIPGCRPILTYLVNAISLGDRSTPYSFVTAADGLFPPSEPGPGEIIINNWLAEDLGAAKGDTLTLRYFLMGPLRALREDSARFMVKSVIPMENPASDPALMPDFPGMTDAGNCRDWETGAPIDLKRIRDKDEEYWKQYRGTPKAFVSIKDGQRLWGNHFGNTTAFRFHAPEMEIPRIEQSLMQKITPRGAGLFFRLVQEEALSATAQSTDFGGLFLGLSFFLLAGALLLTAMLFSYLATRRRSEMAIQATIGFSRGRIFRIMAAETGSLAVLGAIAGVAGGLLYNRLLLLGLSSLWHDAANISLLKVSILPGTLAVGGAAGIITSLAVLLSRLRSNLREPLAELVKKGNGMLDTGYGIKGRTRNLAIAAGSLLASMAMLLWMVIHGKGVDSSLLLIAGGLLIPAGLAMLNLFLAPRESRKEIPGFTHLIFRNLSLRRNRALSAVALLALGTFTLLITAANRKMPLGTDASVTSGTGGFTAWAETSMPLRFDLNSAFGQEQYGFIDEPLLNKVRYVQMPVLQGDDASCLNLNRITRPGILGVPAELFSRRQAFSFVQLDPAANSLRPWETLLTPLAGEVIPGFADQTVIDWGLQLKVGDTLQYTDEKGGTLKIKLMGGLDHSLFQGYLLVSDSLLRRFFPSAAGSRIMLVDGPAERTDTIGRRLEFIFRDYGMMVTPAGAKLDAFNAVENAYISVFMVLGGLGLLIGTIGLGIVLLRNIMERRRELSLYLALGFRKKFIFGMIMTEHAFQLAAGLLLGIISSLPAVIYMGFLYGGEFPLVYISGMLAMVFLNGMVWIFLSSRSVLRKNTLEGLRDE